MAEKLIGARSTRVEDGELVRGAGLFINDIYPDKCLSVTFVRSPHAHARIKTMDTRAAADLPGIYGIYSLDDIRPHLEQTRMVVGMPSDAYLFDISRPVLATEEVAYVGEPILAIVAESRALAEDAADNIVIEYEVLEAVVDGAAALKQGAPRAHSSVPHNLIASFGFGYGDMNKAFAPTAGGVVVRGNYSTHRGGSHSIEGRGVVANWDRWKRKLTVWSSTQAPHAVKRVICDVLGIADGTVQVKTPDMGGGFGPKLVVYQEEIVVALLAKKHGRPIKWIEDRKEHFLSTAQERDQHWDLEMAVDADGKILGVRGAMLHDYGPYTIRGVNVPYGSGVAVVLPYRIPAYSLEIYVVLTNKVPVSSIRGAGQPEGVFALERLMDQAARRLGIGRDRIREINLVRTEEMPCRKIIRMRGGEEVILDSGNYIAAQNEVLEAIGYNEFENRRRVAKKAGKYIGLGMANYVEGTGRGPFEGVTIRIKPQGRVQVATGAITTGQGTKTMLAQIIGDVLQLKVDDIQVVTGDTDMMSYGIGGFNSRQTVMAGNSAYEAAKKMKIRLLEVAAGLWDCSVAEISLENGMVMAKNSSKRASYAELARAVDGVAGYVMPGGGGPGLEVTEYMIMQSMCFSSGSVAVEVEVDSDTGQVKINDYHIVHDCGTVINPTNVNGQIMGGIAHGIGNALYEKMEYNAAGQPLTTTFGDYLLPTADIMPRIHIKHMESKSPLNPLGVKGMGESGVLPTPAAIASAVDDALSEFDVTVDRFPIEPVYLTSMVHNGYPYKFNTRDQNWRSDAKIIIDKNDKSVEANNGKTREMKEQGHGITVA